MSRRKKFENRSALGEVTGSSMESGTFQTQSGQKPCFLGQPVRWPVCRGRCDAIDERSGLVSVRSATPSVRAQLCTAAGQKSIYSDRHTGLPVGRCASQLAGRMVRQLFVLVMLRQLERGFDWTFVDSGPWTVAYALDFILRDLNLTNFSR